MLEDDFTWDSTGSSGGLSAHEVPFGAIDSVLYCQTSTLATTSSYRFETAQDSTGPWFTEASTSLSTGAVQQAAVRITGPFRWMRPFLQTASTGTLRFRLISVR